MDDKLFEIIGRINDKIEDVNVALAKLPSREEVKQIVVDQLAVKAKVDWKEVAKIAAIVIPSGGLGAAIAEIVKAFG